MPKLPQCGNFMEPVLSRRFNILNITWAWKFNHNKDSRHVSPITDSQTL
jgi:hypothetical protein